MAPSLLEATEDVAAHSLRINDRLLARAGVLETALKRIADQELRPHGMVTCQAIARIALGEKW